MLSYETNGAVIGAREYARAGAALTCLLLAVTAVLRAHRAVS